MLVNALDIAPFALPNTPPSEKWFEEPRDIAGVVVEFEGYVPDKIEVSYRRKHWPETQLEQVAKGHPSGFGWVGQDDY